MVIDRSVLATFYNQPTPVVNDISPPHLKSYRQLCQEICDTHQNYKRKEATQRTSAPRSYRAHVLLASTICHCQDQGMSCECEAVRHTVFLAADEQVNEEVIQIIAGGCHLRMAVKRTPAEAAAGATPRVAKDQAARGPENIQHALEQHPDAVAPEELDEQFYWIQCYGC